MPVEHTDTRPTRSHYRRRRCSRFRSLKKIHNLQPHCHPRKHGCGNRPNQNTSEPYDRPAFISAFDQSSDAPPPDADGFTGNVHHGDYVPTLQYFQPGRRTVRAANGIHVCSNAKRTGNHPSLLLPPPAPIGNQRRKNRQPSRHCIAPHAADTPSYINHGKLHTVEWSGC